MPEYYADDFDLPEGATQATISVRVELSDGVSREQTQTVPIQIVGG